MAVALGMPSRRELLARLTSSELTELMAYANLEPFGAPIDDYRAGLSAAAVFNVNRGKDAPVIGPMELMPWHADRVAAPRETPQAVADNVRTFLNAQAADVAAQEKAQS